MDTRILVQIGLSLAAFLVVLLLLSLTRHTLTKFGRKHQFHDRRLFYGRKILSLFFGLFLLVLLSVIWGFNMTGLPIFFASFFGIVGIAFFASWSLLSNITASLIIFFSASYKIADKIKIIDGDNTISGRIRDMSMFSVIIETDEGNFISYPNNLLLQKPVEVLKN